MTNHNLTDKELNELILFGSIRVDKSLIDSVCQVCTAEPICFGSTSCEYVRAAAIARLKKLSSEELTEFVFTDKKLK